MLKKSRSATTTRPTIPMPCRVQQDGDQRPVAVTIYGLSVAVESIEKGWEEGEDWWKDDPLVRVTNRGAGNH